MNLKKRLLKNRKGKTLLELIIVLPMISIVLILVYNMFFLSYKSFSYVNDNFSMGEDIRHFTINIQKEANQGKKANDNTVLYKLNDKNTKEIYIYTDIDDDGIPELVRYRLENNNILKDIKIATNDKFPFEYKDQFKNEKIVLTKVTNENIFGDVERVEEKDKYEDENDHRRKVNMLIKIKTENESTPIVLNFF